MLNRLCSQGVRVLRPVTSTSGRGEATRFEIFHDVLASAVLDWSRRRMVDLEVERQQREQKQQAEMAENRRLAEAERLRAEEAEAAVRREGSSVNRFHDRRGASSALRPRRRLARLVRVQGIDEGRDRRSMRPGRTSSKREHEQRKSRTRT